MITTDPDGDTAIHQPGRLFYEGGQFPPADHIERIAKYKRMRMIFDGKQWEIYERASDLLKDTPFSEQLKKLYIACNIVDILVTKPADLMVGEPPSYESGYPDDSPEQRALNRIVEENDLNQLIHELVIGAGIRGDAFIKVYHAVREDFSELAELGLEPPADVKPEPIIEAVDPSYVFPELSRGSKKRFKAINIAYVEFEVNAKGEEIPYLSVERHVPGYIIYERYRLYDKEVDNSYGVPIPIYTIGEKVPTGRDEDVVPTGVPRMLVFHIPYKSTDETWQGIGGIEKLESVLAAINDRLVQIDYILWKHADPTAYGPDLDGAGDSLKWGGKYIPIRKDDPTPGYMTWDSQLDGAFKELDILLSLVYQMSETPQWLFGTILAGDTRGGTGTSHTDGVAIKARFMPILSKVKRIRVHVDRAIRDALWTAMELENYANEGVEGFESYEPVYPTINWKDGIPRDERELAEIMSIRTGGRPTLDVLSAIKRLDEVDDEKALEIVNRILEDEKRDGLVDPSIFNAPDTNNDGGEDEDGDS